jgi:proteasome lid subunit RPN8/RPN11
MRDARYQAVFRQSVLDQIHAHGKSSMEAEVCGVLIGEVFFDRLAGWAYVEHCIPGDTAVGKQTQVTFTSETWTKIHETLEKNYPGKKIVGWYHTHPGFGIFLSGMDLFIQDNFFNQPWQIATVYDPHSGEEGTFIWREGKSQREGVLVEIEDGAAPVEPTHRSDALADLTQRVKRLERRLDFILTGFLFLVLLALVTPLILFALMPDTIKKLPPILHKSLFNSVTQPADKPDADQKPAPGAKAAPVDSKTGNKPAPGDLSAPSAPNPDDRLLRPEPSDDKTPGGPKTLTPKVSGGR